MQNSCAARLPRAPHAIHRFSIAADRRSGREADARRIVRASDEERRSGDELEDLVDRFTTLPAAKKAKFLATVAH